MRPKILFFFIVLLIVSLACGSSTSKELADALQTPTTTFTKTSQDATNTPQTPVKPNLTATSKPTPLPPPPTPEPVDVIVTAQGFGQDQRQVGFAFIVENPNPAMAVENLQYQVTAYNAEGAVVKTESGYIQLVLPKQKLGLGGVLLVDEGVTVSKLEVQLNKGDLTASEKIPTFTVDSVSYYPREITSLATGIIKNPYNRTITQLRVAAVAYDEAGTIIGGGFTFLNFIQANGTSGVEIRVTNTKEKAVASIELYPALSGLSMLTTETVLPDGAIAMNINKYGFGQHDQGLGYGILVENPNENFAIEGSQYQITAFDRDGKVVATEEGYIEVVLPKQILGVGGLMYLLDQEMVVGQLDVQVIPGKFEESDAIPSFASENVTYLSGTYSSKVTGQITSPYNTDITNIRVSAIVYNDARDIVGGGFTYLDFCPANGKASVEVTVASSDQPTTAELYASVSALSDFK